MTCEHLRALVRIDRSAAPAVMPSRNDPVNMVFGDAYGEYAQQWSPEEGFTRSGEPQPALAKTL
jgi:hypothetical protein